MSDAPTLTRSTPATSSDTDGRTIRPRRSLPGGRAVIGAFLVVVAAVGTFGAYLSATAAPTTSYLLAERSFALGHVISEADLTGTAGVVGIAMDLPDEVAARAFPSDPTSVERLLGQVVVAPIERGDPLLVSQFADVAAAAGGVVLSFSIPTDRALAGRVAAGEVVDLVATFPGAGALTSETRVVARQVTVLAASASGDGLNGGRMTVTVDVADLATAQAVQHAVDVGQVAVLRGVDPADQAAPAGATPAASATRPSATATAERQEED